MPEALSEGLDVPVDVKWGHVGLFQLSVPWSKLGSKPVGECSVVNMKSFGGGASLLREHEIAPFNAHPNRSLEGFAGFFFALEASSG